MLTFVFIVMMIRMWFEARAIVVCKVVNLAKFDEIVVISGDMGCWAGFRGILVGVFRFSII